MALLTVLISAIIVQLHARYRVHAYTPRPLYTSFNV